MDNNKDRDIQDNTFKKLCEACFDGNIEVLEEILRHNKVDINGHHYKVGTPLICAVDNGHLDIVRRLLQHPEVDINGRRWRGDTPLMCAVRKSYLDTVKTFLDVPEIQLNRCNNTGNSALHLHEASFRNNVSIMKLLCQDRRCCPGVVNKKNSDGITDGCRHGTPGYCEGARHLGY